MILDNILQKEGVRQVLQDRYDDCAVEIGKSKDLNMLHSESHYHGMLVACLRIAEDLDIDLDKWFQ